MLTAVTTICELRTIIQAQCNLWVMTRILHFWLFNQREGFLSQRAAVAVLGPNRHRTPTAYMLTYPPPSPSRVPWSPPICSINKPGAGHRQWIMVHLEVTAKENRALCITNGDRDKLSKALRNLDKGLSKHVQNWIHFFFGCGGELSSKSHAFGCGYNLLIFTFLYFSLC